MKLSINNVAKEPMWKVLLLSSIQTIVFYCGIVCSFMFIYLLSLDDRYLMNVVILPFFLLFFLFNISCNYNNKRLMLAVISVVPIIYLITALFGSHLVVDHLMMMIMSYIMFAFSYSKYNIDRVRLRLWVCLPLIISIVQVVVMFIALNKFTNLYQIENDPEVMYAWDDCIIYIISLFFVLSLVTNFTIFVWKKWWIPVLGVLGIVAFSAYVFLQGKHFDMVVPEILILFYVLGVIISFLVDLKFSGFDFKGWFKKVLRV